MVFTVLLALSSGSTAPQTTYRMSDVQQRMLNKAATVQLNTFAASYLNTQGLNNSCLKSPASTLVDLNFNRARSALSA